MEIEEQHRNQKIPMYQELLQFLFQLLMGQKTNGKHLEEGDIIEFMSKFTQNLILWGSNDVIKKYSEYRTYFSNRGVGKETSIKEIELLEDLLLAIRKDMGHNNKSLKRGDVLSLFINDIEKYLYKLK
ncbi:hypothetical protein ETC02_17355 [Geobacillus sp. DSP4a]|nr:hypothetical protein [Geobacillus sp. DSP4a]